MVNEPAPGAFEGVGQVVAVGVRCRDGAADVLSCRRVLVHAQFDRAGSVECRPAVARAGRAPGWSRPVISGISLAVLCPHPYLVLGAQAPAGLRQRSGARLVIWVVVSVSLVLAVSSAVPSPYVGPLFP